MNIPGVPVPETCKLCGAPSEIELAGEHYCESCLSSAGSCCWGETSCPN